MATTHNPAINLAHHLATHQKPSSQWWRWGAQCWWRHFNKSNLKDELFHSWQWKKKECLEKTWWENVTINRIIKWSIQGDAGSGFEEKKISLSASSAPVDAWSVPSLQWHWGRLFHLHGVRVLVFWGCPPHNPLSCHLHNKRLCYLFLFLEADPSVPLGGRPVLMCARESSSWFWTPPLLLETFI